MTGSSDALISSNIQRCEVPKIGSFYLLILFNFFAIKALMCLVTLCYIKKTLWQAAMHILKDSDIIE